MSFEPSALRPAVADALGHASVLVHASPRETFGVTAVEALASGTPVVALDSGGVTETVGTDGRLGEIVHEPDPEAMAAAVVRTLERRPTFDAAVLRASAVDRYGASSVATRIADLYDELRPAAGPPVRAGIAFRADPAGSPVAPDRSVLVVGFLTHRTERILRTLPPATLARIDLLCGSGDDVATLPAGLAKVTAVDIDGPFRAALGPDGDRPRAASKRARIGRLVRDPIGIVRRRRVRSQRERYRLAAAEAALEVVVEARGAALESADVVGVTGLDYQAIARVPAAAARIVPGGLRWLADQQSGEIA